MNEMTMSPKKKERYYQNKNQRKKPKRPNSNYVMPWTTSHINLDHSHMGNTISLENVVEPVSSV